MTRIQSRPLPAPPAPKRNKRASASPAKQDTQYLLSPHPISSSEMSSRTLVGSGDDETTLADSCVDSMHTSCAETLVGSEREEDTDLEMEDDDQEFCIESLSPEEQMRRFANRRGRGDVTPPVQGRGKFRVGEGYFRIATGRYIRVFKGFVSI